MAMRCTGHEAALEYCDTEEDSSIASDATDVITEGLGSQMESFDRRVGNVAGQVQGKTTVKRGRGRNKLFDLDNAAGRAWNNSASQDRMN